MSKKTEFYQLREERRASEPKMKPGFSFLSKQEYDELEPTPWLDANGKPNGLEMSAATQDQPGEEKPGKAEGDLGINALIYGHVQLNGEPKPKHEFKQHKNTSKNDLSSACRLMTSHRQL